MKAMRFVPAALVLGLVASACGSSSGPSERFEGAGPGGGVAEGCLAPSCGTCDSCMSLCMCKGGSVEQCSFNCQGRQQCAAPEGCYDTCLCQTGDVAFCDAQCMTAPPTEPPPMEPPPSTEPPPMEPPPPTEPPPMEPPPPTEPPPPPPPGAGCPTDGSPWDAGWQSFECRVLDLTNQRRALGANCGGQVFGPAGPLEMQAQLRASSRGHSADMGNMNFFDHVNPFTGTDPGARIRAAGFTGRTWGENIAAGQPTPESVVDGWMNSPGHCRNIMNPAFRFLGVGYFFAPGSQFGHLWTQNFGG